MGSFAAAPTILPLTANPLAELYEDWAGTVVVAWFAGSSYVWDGSPIALFTEEYISSWLSAFLSKNTVAYAYISLTIVPLSFGVCT